jgi:hypothetical protein
MAADCTARQVFDLHLPAPRHLIVTEHLATQHPAQQCRCMACSAQTRAALARGVIAPAQYGARFAGSE